MARMSDVRESVRRRYAAAAAEAAQGGGCCGPAAEEACSCGPAPDGSAGAGAAFGGSLYDAEARAGVPEAALDASLGCGVPTAVADLRAGETVLDLGSGAGADLLIAARRVEPGGKAIGLDMTEEMLELARRNADEAGVANVELVKGYIEELPLPDASVDAVISNCVINLSADKPRVLREAARVLRGGGRLAVSDVIADDGLDEAARTELGAWAGCVAGALTRAEYARGLEEAGLVDAEIVETHRVHEHAAAAVVRARKPAPA